MKVSDILNESILNESITFWVPDAPTDKKEIECRDCDGTGVDGYTIKGTDIWLHKKPKRVKQLAKMLIDKDDQIRDIRDALYDLPQRMGMGDAAGEAYKDIKSYIKKVTRPGSHYNKLVLQMEALEKRIFAKAKKLMKNGFEKSADCRWCKGTGKETETSSEAPELNVSNRNAGIILDMLGIQYEYAGDISPEQIPDLKKRLIKIKNQSDGMSKHTKDTKTSQKDLGMKRSTDDDGVTRIEPQKGAKMIDVGVSDEQVDRYYNAIMGILDYAQKNKMEIVWG